MFEQYPYLVGTILTLLHLCLLVYFTKEVYYFYLDLTHKEEEVDDDEEQDSSYTTPSLEEWIKAQHASIRESIGYELKRGRKTFIPSFPEDLDQRAFNNVLNELREKGYSLVVKTGVDGYIKSVTFDVSEAQNPSESKEVGSDVLGYDVFVFENIFTPSDSDTYVVSLPKGITSASELLDTLYLRLKLPEYFGFNWNALSDCLRNLHWIKQKGVVLRHSELPALPESELQVYLDVLSEAVTGWGGSVVHSLVVSFPYAVREELELRFPRK